MQLVNLSTPANYFHALRRQVLAPLAKPAGRPGAQGAAAPSRLASRRWPSFAGGFRTVIADERKARRVVMATGKLAVLLERARERAGIDDVALVRLEQLYPLDAATLDRALAPYRGAELVWAQEEPENMGYFGWLDRRLEAIAGRRWRLVTRPASPAPASGPEKWDEALLNAVIAAALEG